jgi:hypothetical protein
MGSWTDFRVGLNVWRKEKYFALLGIEPVITQPIA